MSMKVFFKSVPFFWRARCNVSSRMRSTLSSSDALASYYDVVVVGAGMVGSAMTCAIGKSSELGGKRVLLVEAAPARESGELKSQPFSNRVSAISPGSQSLLEDLGAWKHITSIRAKSFSKMHVWDSCSSGAITFDAKEQGHDVIATIVENPVILHGLHQAIASDVKTVDFAFHSTIGELALPDSEGTDDLVTLVLDNGHRLSTSLLIGADGHNSRIRKLAKMDYYEQKYDQSGIVATVTFEKESENEVAWQQFHPSGPIALLPLSATQSSLVWSTSRQHAKTLARVSDAAFVDALNNALQNPVPSDLASNTLLRGTQQIMSTLQPGLFAGSQNSTPPVIQSVEPKSRSVFPYGLGHAEKYVKKRIALVGDAAHRIHPLAGQGVNLGFGDVSCLQHKLQDSARIGEDIGYLKYLLEYESERQRHVVPMTLGIDLLKRLFSTDSYPVAAARAIGLQACNTFTPVKNAIASFARQ